MMVRRTNKSARYDYAFGLAQLGHEFMAMTNRQQNLDCWVIPKLLRKHEKLAFGKTFNTKAIPTIPKAMPYS